MPNETPKLANPAVVGLAGFGPTTLVLQFHNVGWMPSVGPVVSLGLIFGGFAQLLAGLQEFKTGNNFGYSAFTSYGAFWISLALIFISNKYQIFPVSQQELGYYLVAWTLYTAIMWVAAMRIHGAMAITFTTLLIGFILLDLAKFVDPSFGVIAGYELMTCAAAAWYMMARAIFAEAFGREILPAGKAWLK